MKRINIGEKSLFTSDDLRNFNEIFRKDVF